MSSRRKEYLGGRRKKGREIRGRKSSGFVQRNQDRLFTSLVDIFDFVHDPDRVGDGVSESFR